MLRTLVGSALRTASFAVNRSASTFVQNQRVLVNNTCAGNLALLYKPTFNTLISATSNNLLQSTGLLGLQQQQTRTLTKFSLNKGKRKAVKAVIKRFKRLDWGVWIRTYTGRHKKMFKKSAARKRRLRQHVFTNSTQSWLLDKMVTKFWRRPKYYVDDPYEPYHRRDEFYTTKRRPFSV